MARSPNQALSQGLDLSKKTFQGQRYDYEFVNITDIQLNEEIFKPPLGANTRLQDDLKNKTKFLLNITTNK